MLIRSSDRSRHQRRQCVACGYSGRFVDRAEQSHCPRCLCDFTLRPPRSYAEMEGLTATDIASSRSKRGSSSAGFGEWRLVERWLVFFFLISVASISLLALTIAALPKR